MLDTNYLDDSLVESNDGLLTSLAESGVDMQRIMLSASLSRGLDYYTGTVYETVIPKLSELGSVCSGGRYNDLVRTYIDGLLSVCEVRYGKKL